MLLCNDYSLFFYLTFCILSHSKLFLLIFISVKISFRIYVSNTLVDTFYEYQNFISNVRLCGQKNKMCSNKEKL